MANRYEYYDTGDSNDTWVYANFWRGQTFTPSVSHKITSVKLLLFRAGSPGTITVGIRATDEYGLPTGNDLCSGTTDGDTLPTIESPEWREITLGAGYNLVADTKYAIVVRAVNGDSSNHAAWRNDDTTPTYEGGSYVSSGQSGAPGTWAAITATDFMFEEWGEAGQEYTRSGTAYLGLVGTGTRPVGYVRSDVGLLGLLATATRSWALSREDAALLGLKATASRIITHIRAQTALLGLKATASQAVDYAAKTGTALLGLVATGSRAIALSRSKTALLGLKAIGAMSTLGHYVKEAVVYLGLAVTGTRSIVLTRVDTALLGLKATATKAITLTRLDTALLGLKTQGILILPYIRTGTVYLGLKITASRSFALTRLNTALLGLKAVATRSLVLSRAKTALLGLKVIGSLGAPGRALKLIIVTTQNRKVNVITSLYRKIRIFTE